MYDAVETKCCGVLLCMPCSDKLMTSMMACPQCRAYPLVANENQFMRRKVRQLHIYCVNRHCCNTVTSHVYPIAMHPIPPIPSRTIGVDHCEWSGEINDLQSHLDNHCPHATVTCQYNCGVKIVRCHKDVHEAKVCRKRPFSCWFCDMKATAEEIDGHATKCNKRPIKCPNKCSTKLLQGELQLHLQQCSLRLQEISCEFEHAGCKEKILRKDYDSHIKDNTQKHLRLMSAQFATLKQKVDQQTQDTEEEIVRLKKEAEKAKKSINLLMQAHLFNINIRVTLGGASDPFYVFGYCMNVECVSIGGEVGMTLLLRPGRYDNALSWPLQGMVTLLLLHPTDSSEHKEVAHQLGKAQRPTEAVMIEGYCIFNTRYLHKHNECRLLVKSATFD